MSSIQHQQRLLAEASLGLFSATYEEILKSKGLKHGPVSGKELLEMMNEAIFGDGDVLAPQKPNSETAPEQATWEEQRNQRFCCDLLSLIRKRKVPRARRRSDLLAGYRSVVPVDYCFWVVSLFRIERIREQSGPGSRMILGGWVRALCIF